MRKLIFACFCLTMLLAGCKKADRLTQFEVTYNSSITVQNGTGVSIPISLYTPDIETNSESTFAVNDTRKDKIQEIRLTGLVMTITAPAGQEFDFLKDVEVFISADGLSEILLASKYDIDNSIEGELTLEVSGADFQEYIKKDEFTLRVRTVTDETILTDIEIDLETVFWVNAKLIGKA